MRQTFGAQRYEHHFLLRTYHKRLLLLVVAHENDSGACREWNFLFSKDYHDVIGASLRLDIEVRFFPKVILCFSKLELCLAFLIFIVVDSSCEVAELIDDFGVNQFILAGRFSSYFNYVCYFLGCIVSGFGLCGY